MELLEQHFDTAFAAPGGINKLRELVLALAMQGKLVPQDPSDPPASQLLKDIEAEKSRLWRDGKIKAPKPLPEIKTAEMPYALPLGWEWVRLGEIGVWKSGSTPSRNNSKYYGGDIPWVKSGEVKQGRITKTEELITELALNECSLSLNPVGSVLVAMYGANIGEVGILDIEAATNQAVCACRTYTAFDERYLLNLIASLKPYFISQGAGAAQPNISREKIVATPFPLPPLPEQHRIVAKIDQLMARCDELERLRAEREQKRRSVHTAALKRLLDAQAADSIADAWQFISRHFSDLYSVKENVAELRKAILQLAVMGKLVPQNPNDPPASQLLKEIEAEKKRLVNEGKIKAPKPSAEIRSVEIPYVLPQGWEWVRLADIASKITDGDHKTPPRIESGYRLLSAKNVRDGYLDFDNCDCISEQHYLKSRERCCPETGDLLIVSVGGTIGRTSLVPDDSGFALVRSVALVKPLRFSSSYLKYAMDSSLLQDSIHARKRGGAQPCLYLSEIEQFVFPLPPFSEQHRIVAKIEQLMVLCDTLEQRIDDANSKQTELLDAVMAKV